jgi:hypothetical protein
MDLLELLKKLGTVAAPIPTAVGEDIGNLWEETAISQLPSERPSSGVDVALKAAGKEFEDPVIKSHPMDFSTESMPFRTVGGSAELPQAAGQAADLETLLALRDMYGQQNRATMEDPVARQAMIDEMMAKRTGKKSPPLADK